MKKAFTLAEVLITLAIVGIVAALTIPTMVQNYEKKILSARIKKFVSTFNQAYKMAIANYGDSTYWKPCTLKEGTTACGVSYGGENIQKILSCMKATDVTANIPDSYKQDFVDNYYEIKGGRYNKDKLNFWQLSDGGIIFNTNDLLTDDGVSVTSFFVDVNGLGKPNRIAKDIFFFAQMHTPAKTSQATYQNWRRYKPLSQGLYLDSIGYHSSSCSKLSEDKTLSLKYICANNMLQENNWEFPDNYPWDAF